MTARIYTIPARSVVEGMVLDGLTVTSSCPGNIDVMSGGTDAGEGNAWHIALSNVMRWYLRGAMVDVTLPGPSPRELLCQCAGQSIDPTEIETFDPVTDKHAKGCPADGFRVWPVGAEWDADRELWRVPDPRDGEHWWVDTGDLLGGLADFTPDDAFRICAAFCEPEP